MRYLIGCVCTLFLSTALTRSVPFLFVDRLRRNPRVLLVRKWLPASVMLLLCLQSLSHIKFKDYPYGLPEILGSVIVLWLHQARRNALLSIAAGTTVYGLALHFLPSGNP